MFKLLKRLSWKELIMAIICVGLIALQVWLDLKMPDYMQQLTIHIKSGSGVEKVWQVGGYMLACALGSLGAAFVVSFIASKVSSVLSFRLRGEIYKKVHSFSMEEVKSFSTSSLITRTTNDVGQIQMVTSMALQILMRAPIMAVWAILKIAGKSWQWTLSTGIAVFVLAIMLTIIIIFAVPKFKIIQKLTDSLNGVTRENLKGVRVVRAYNAEEYQEQKFDKVNSKLTKTQLFTQRVMAIMSPGMSLISNGLQLAIYYIGAHLIAGATSDMGKLLIFSDMTVYVNYAMRIVMSFMMLILLFMMIPRASVSAKRINEVLDTKLKIQDGEFCGNGDATGEVEFRNVSFKYPDAKEYVVRNVSFKAKKGETVAFIGSTGSGKSTLINLIPRFYDVTDGDILIDGVNVKDYNQKELRKKIGYVPQKAVLFSGTISSNIDFGEGESEISENDIKNACSVAQAKSFVERKTDGYESLVAQGGTNFSGGQKQRLSIARAVARKPEIFIFDDSFSALDYKTDKVLRKELSKHTKNSTKFIVAQRIGTILDADKIVVLEQGDVVGIGTHKELLKTCNVYREIAYSQLSKEELENE